MLVLVLFLLVPQVLVVMRPVLMGVVVPVAFACSVLVHMLVLVLVAVGVCVRVGMFALARMRVRMLVRVGVFVLVVMVMGMLVVALHGCLLVVSGVHRYWLPYNPANSPGTVRTHNFFVRTASPILPKGHMPRVDCLVSYDQHAPRLQFVLQRPSQRFHQHLRHERTA